MKTITDIQNHAASGGEVRWKGNKIDFIDFRSMNLGGKLKVRLHGRIYKTEVDISEIETVKTPLAQ